MLLNLIGFNISWFGLIILGNIFIPFVICWLGTHLYYSAQRIAEVKLILCITCIGICVDSIWQLTGVLIFPNELIIPLWLMILWSAFAATVAHSLQILSRSKYLQFAIGFIFPPMSYIAGTSLSSVELGHTLLFTYCLLGVVWAVLMVLFFHLKTVFFKKESQHE
ncbi:DUF2878 domain-containing protein [Colwellia sp. E2M01]|uniref:DUF2878 domain-containing protein n=1 Tax=Colwellia sp. E2M01 TaxID=2841561 RepID=UPI001C0829FE|nr:DUF2878 domain-containing protein [Colwellia sp. E2M01]MBU2872118.1 DUF2878 domain-containing protein [Colwellia sp. E2M01]